ncbi:hypothetical protein JXA47_16775 [Candidatus Sumerlaeota bacterium]|nr:hypothetical protein [Candidatus Sumerlaeota bacterium]
MRRVRRQLVRLALICLMLWWGWGHRPQVRDFLMAPIRLGQGIAVSIEIEQIRSALIQHRQVHGGLPPAHAFPAFVRTNFAAGRRDPLRDLWGQNYGYGVARDGSAFHVWSRGPDGLRDTADDIRVEWRSQG